MGVRGPTPTYHNGGDVQTAQTYRDVLNDMELVGKDRFGKALTLQATIDEINKTAQCMESMYDSMTTGKTHIGLKE